MFTLEQIKQAHSQVKSGADFPQYIQDIKTLWVIFYEVSLRDGQVEYCGVDNFSVSTSTGCDSLTISSILDVEQFRSDLKNHQNGNTDYLTFCDDSAKSGIEKWRVTMDGMTCMYYDIHQNEVLIEKIPG